MAVYCILLKEGIATKKTKSLIPKGKGQNQQSQSLQGSLWSLNQNECDGDKFFQRGADLSRITIKLVSLEDETITHVCVASDVARLSDEQCELLLAVSTCADRYRVFQDQPWMSEATKIDVNTVVYVSNLQGISEKGVAIVRFKGRCQNIKGIWFGLELSKEYSGLGTSDGSFRKARHFKCALDDGLFVSISRIRRCKDPSLFHQRTQGSNVPVEHQEPSDYSPGETPPQLSIGEKVVWMDDEGLPQMAVVHWIGHLPDSHDNEWTVGVEFENRIGTGTGKYKDTQLFKARNGHASLIPLMGLIKAEEFFGGIDNIPVATTDRQDHVSPGSPHGETSQSMRNTVLPKQPVLDENYYRESYKTNRPPKPVSDGKKFHPYQQDSSDLEGGEYDYIRSDHNRVANSDPLYARVDDVRNQSLLDGLNRSSKGSQSEVIYTLPNKTKTALKTRHTEPLLDKRTIKVNCPSTTATIETYDGLDNPSKTTNSNLTPTSPNNQYPTGSQFSPVGTSPMTRKKQTAVMHEDRRDDKSAQGYSPSSHAPSYDGHSSKPPVTGAKSLTAAEVGSQFDVGSVVEVTGNPANCKYGVIRWIGCLQDKLNPIVGLEMEEESTACTDGTFGGQRMFECPPRKAFFVYLSKISKDSRFEESDKYLHRTASQSFGSLDCPDVEEDVPPVDEVTDLQPFIGKNKGIQGHHNSCYLDASLFSMFAFTQTFDALMFREKEKNDLDQYTEVQKVLKDGIVNPLRKNFFVRADKVLKLRMLLDKLSSVQGLTTEEKDPEEFLNCLLQQIFKTEPLLKFSNGQTSCLYQLFVEKDEKIHLPTTEQLLELSFMQADMKLSEAPNCLVLQMPRFGKEFKMYERIMPSLYLDVTDILEHGPRECHLCGGLATHECRDCFQLAMFQSGLSKTAFCANCLKKFHQHQKRQSHKYKVLQRNREYENFVEEQRQRGINALEQGVPREKMELFAVICIETSHYVAFVKCGYGKKAPWVLFDSMADRMGAQNGYNIPEVKECTFLPDMLEDENKLFQQIQSKPDREMGDLKRLLCDGYICMYRSEDLYLYN